jgi:beta-phosphoglucomutase-like phosphatase (HAD superfamily)
MPYSFQHRGYYVRGVQAVIADLAGTVIDFGSCAPSGAFIELFRRHT